MKFHTCGTPAEVCDWCNTHSAFVIISITYWAANLEFVIFYEDFSNYKPKHVAAHNIDPGIAIQAADAPLQTVRCPSYVYSGDRFEVAEPVY